MKQALRQRMPIPKKIQDAPSLWPGLEFYYEAWVELDSCRAIGFGVGPIPWTAIESYCDTLELDAQERTRTHRLIRALDRVYLDHINKRD